MSDPDPPTPGGTPRPKDAAGMGKGRTILVVDDDDAVRTMLARLLAAHGYSVIQAANVDAAIAVFERGERPDLVVSDVVMPGRSGIELRRHLAELAPGLPVILLSGYSPDAPAEFAARQPDTRFVPKPFAVDQLLKLVEETLASRP